MAPVDTMADTETEHTGGTRWMWVVFSVIAVSAIVGGIWTILRFRIQPIDIRPPPFPSVHVSPGGKTAIEYPHGTFVTTVATFNDELFAYLMYQHYRLSKDFTGEELLLRYNPGKRERNYEVILVLSSDLIAGIDRAADLNEDHRIELFAWRLVASRTLATYVDETKLFVSAYNLPVKRKNGGPVESATPKSATSVHPVQIDHGSQSSKRH